MAMKRSQNEGSIFKRKDGRWVAQVTIGGKHIGKYFKTQGEARDWLHVTRAQLQDGLTLSGAQKTVKEFLLEWLSAYESSVRPKTFQQYDQIVNQHIIPLLGKIKLKDIRPDQIQVFYNSKVKSGTSARTVLMIHAVLHRAFNQALKWGLIGRNPAHTVNRPKIKRKEMKTLTDMEVRIFLLACKDNRYEVLYWLAISTGLRQGELLGLKWSDVDWNNRRLHVQRQLQRLPEGLVFTEPKSASGRRVISLGQVTIEKLREYLTQLQLEKKIMEAHWEENDLILPSTRGTPLDPRNLLRNFKALLKKAGLPDIRFHDLRHTAATLMLQQGTHPKVVQERLGHSDISLTLNTYSHVLPAMQEEAAEKMDEIMMPIDVSDELKKLGESKAYYGGSQTESKKDKND
jgi:integrase